MGVPRGETPILRSQSMSYTSGESHGFSPSVLHRLDHEVSLQGAGRRVAGADTNDYPAAVQRTWRPDRLRGFVARTCPYVRGNPAAYCSSHRVQMEFPDLRKRYWGRHFWARGYFSTTS